jgi:hypothetical protein
MSSNERRLPQNVALRQKIDHIQVANKHLKETIDRMESHAIESARRIDSGVAQSVKHETDVMQDLLTSQALALEYAKRQMMGDALNIQEYSERQPLISDEEMVALRSIHL